MCWNAQTSITSFILGTIINISVILYFKSSIITTICIIWQWVLMMQLSEFLIWKDQNCGKMNKIGTELALFFNLTQPIFVYILLIMTSKVDLKLKIVSSVTILIYICYMMINLNKNKEYTCITPTEDCSHLNLKWWNDFKIGGKLHSLSIIIIVLCLVRPISITIFSLIYIFTALLISHKFYGCGGPSMWCWLVVPFPIFLGIFYKMKFLN
jgi:hypothetical protein